VVRRLREAEIQGDEIKLSAFSLQVVIDWLPRPVVNDGLVDGWQIGLKCAFDC
jgi:hypothetical protein